MPALCFYNLESEYINDFKSELLQKKINISFSRVPYYLNYFCLCAHFNGTYIGCIRGSMALGDNSFYGCTPSRASSSIILIMTTTAVISAVRKQLIALL